MRWFAKPPVCVADSAKPGLVRNINSLKAAADELLKWPKTAKRDRAARLVAYARIGKASLEVAKRAFELAAKEAGVWLPYRGL